MLSFFCFKDTLNPQDETPPSAIETSNMTEGGISLEVIRASTEEVIDGD